MEGYNTVPEPARPEDEGRIDDIAKAQAMAEAGKDDREFAAGYRKVVSEETPIEKGRVSSGEKAKIVNLGTFEIKPGTAGNPSSEIVKESLRQGFNKEMSDEAIREESADRLKNYEHYADANESVAAEKYDIQKEKEQKLKEVKNSLGMN